MRPHSYSSDSVIECLCKVPEEVEVQASLAMDFKPGWSDDSLSFAEPLMMQDIYPIATSLTVFWYRSDVYCLSAMSLSLVSMPK
jgi:hypothetical protein